jgi:pilus assembly protein Flp/PilA
MNVTLDPRGRYSIRPVIALMHVDERTATATEYGLIATGIAVAIIPVITGLGARLKTTFTSIQTALR